MANKRKIEPELAEAAETAPETPVLPEQERPAEETPPELEAWKDKALRAQADLVNFRNRSQREREQLWSEARADTAARFLPVLDNLERALEAPCADENYKQGVEMTLRQFTDILTKLGISEIEAFEKPFDPQWMDAVLHEESDDWGENTVTQVFEKGYRIGDRVLRHAVVKVVN
ncbi:MAG: nucleotide exchange factor GrpE [Oscillospiraceae bacterium]|jgi:molecular chaperone GrpE|nr:nucleotide exchange factor GrpE [Oscillospiraceae bacterium]